MEIFEQIENFFRRLEIYTDSEVPPTLAMKDTMAKIMVEVLNILAIATKETKQSTASELGLCIMFLLVDFGPEKFLKKLAGLTAMKDALKRLDKLTNEEALMASAQIWKNTHVISEKLTVVSNKVDDVKRSSSVSSSLTVERLTRSQGTTYGRA